MQFPAQAVAAAAIFVLGAAPAASETSETAEKPTGHSPALSVFEGVEYQMTPRFAFDLSAQHFTVTGGVTDRQILFGIAVTFGKLQ